MAKVVSASDLTAWINANAYEVTVSPPEPIPPEPDSDPKPVGFDGNFQLLWRDEFDGSSLDLNIWEPNWLAGNDTAITKPINSREIACFDPKQIKVSNSILRIDAIQKRQQDNQGKWWDYTSGCMTSQKSKEWAPPFIIEFCARMHCGSDKNRPLNWPAVWLNGHHTSWPSHGENDVMEALKSGVKAHYHGPNGSGGDINWGGSTLSGQDYTAWHTFACELTSNKAEYRYDGKSVGTLNDSRIVEYPNYMVVNLGISDTEGGPKQLPSWFEIDYVRVWRRV